MTKYLLIIHKRKPTEDDSRKFHIKKMIRFVKKEENNTKEAIFIPAAILETDKYGHKTMLKKVNEMYRCPNDNSFLKWKDKKQGIAFCVVCGFERKVG